MSGNSMALLAGLSRVNEETGVRIGVWRMLRGMEIPKHDMAIDSPFNVLYDFQKIKVSVFAEHAGWLHES